MAKTWENNWGKGPGDDKAPGSDTVGGHFCWDWASGFDNAAESVNSGIWDNSFEKYASTPTGSGTPVHYAVKISIITPQPRGSGTTCDGFTYDDGFMDGSLVHGAACKPNPPFPAPGSGYNPTPGSNDPNDFGHPDDF